NGAIDELKKLGASVAVVVDELDDVRSVSEQIIAEDSPIRAVIAPYIPSQLVSALASEGIASFQASPSACAALAKQKKLGLPKSTAWGDATAATAGKAKVELKWLAVDLEQKWTHAGRSTKAAPAKPAAKVAAKA